MTLNAVSLVSACRRVTDYCTNSDHNVHVCSSSTEPMSLAEGHHVTINNNLVMKGDPNIVKA